MIHDLIENLKEAIEIEKENLKECKDAGDHSSVGYGMAFGAYDAYCYVLRLATELSRQTTLEVGDE